jgi:hypothetical protein
MGELDAGESTADAEDAELERELAAAIAAGALPEGAVLAPKEQQQQVPLQDQPQP